MAPTDRDAEAPTPGDSETSRVEPSSLAAGEVDRSLSHSVKEGCLHAVMLGAGEAYLAPFAIALGAGSVVVGTLASLPLLVGALAQVAAVHLLGRATQRKGLVLAPAVLQGLSLLPLVALPILFPSIGPEIVILGALFYFALGNFTVPAWNSWMGDLVPPRTLGNYFGRRESLRTFSQVVALLLAGAALSVSRSLGSEMVGYVAIFSVACLARLSSSYHLWRTAEPSYRPPSSEESFTFIQFLRRMPGSNFGRFTVYIALIKWTTYLASPFFTLYMLRDLEFTYLEFVAASTACVLSQAFTYHSWGKISDRVGNIGVLKLTGLLVPVVPLLWLISPRFEAVLIYQAVSGFVWAGFMLSSANFLFDTVSPPKRARCVAYYNVLVNAGIFLGATAGGLIAPHLPSSLSLLGLTWPLASHLQVLFLISGIARFLVSVAFLPLLREARQVEKMPSWQVIFRVAGLSAIRGFQFSIFSGKGPPVDERR